MWIWIAYYVLVLVYSIFLLVTKRPSAVLQFLLLVSVPFVGILLIIALLWKSDRVTSLPEWLIRRQQLPEADWLIPDKEKEKNVVPFSDALYLNSSLLRRQLLIDMLKKQQRVRRDVLQQALENDDTETAHYAAVAIQKSKSESTKRLNALEKKNAENLEDIVTLYELKNELVDAIHLEFLDVLTEQQLRQRHLEVLRQIRAIDPTRDIEIYKDIVGELERSNAQVEEFEEVANQLRTNFEPSEEVLLLLMKIAYLTKNQTTLKETVATIRSAAFQLSPGGLQQLRFWMQG
ncbi:hypothetical protein LG275_11940 [Chryseomicrobium palamuruense]